MYILIYPNPEAGKNSLSYFFIAAILRAGADSAPLIADLFLFDNTSIASL